MKLAKISDTYCSNSAGLLIVIVRRQCDWADCEGCCWPVLRT